MKQFIIIVFIISGLNLFGQISYDNTKISKKTNKIVKKIEKVNELMGSAIGEGGMRPEQYNNFEELQQNATKEELILLTNHPNGVVSCYSFWALTLIGNVDFFNIVKDHINDDRLVHTQFGCIGSQEKVGDFFINVATPQYVDLDSKKLNELQFKELDSILIYKDNNLDARFSAIANAEPTEQLYPIIRDLVTKSHNQSAIVTLAKYQKEQDIELILNNKEEDEYHKESGYGYTYLAILNYPRPEFLPLLEKNVLNYLDDSGYDTEWRGLYKAIANYKNEKAVELLNLPFTKATNADIREYHIEFIYDAIIEQKNKIFDDILWKIWEDEKLITLDGFKYLLKLNPSKVYELTKKASIENYQIKETKSVPNIDETIFNDSLEETMLNFILINDKPLGYKIITDNIESADVHSFGIYASKISDLKDKYFIDSLFKRLEKEGNPHTYLQIVETLISFKDDSINTKILQIRKSNEKLNTGWGSDKLNQLLKENNIK